MFAAAGTEQENVHEIEPDAVFEAVSVARVRPPLQGVSQPTPVIPDGAPSAPIRNLELVLQGLSSRFSDVQLHIVVARAASAPE
jgi:hypothetical protein